MASLNVRAALLSVSFLILALGLWEMATQPPEADAAMTEYERLMGVPTRNPGCRRPQR